MRGVVRCQHLLVHFDHAILETVGTIDRFCVLIVDANFLGSQPDIVVYLQKGYQLSPLFVADGRVFSP